MNNRSCQFCRNYCEIQHDSGECRAEPPNTEGVFPTTAPNLWCGRFAALETEKSPGRKPRISDDVILDVVRLAEKGGDAHKRSSLVKYLGEEGFGQGGISPSAALSRIMKLIRNGALGQGESPPRNLKRPEGVGIYLWLADGAPAPTGDLLAMIRTFAPDRAKAASMRTLHRMCNPGAVALSTYSTKLNAMVDSGLIVRTENGYYAAEKSETEV